MTTVRSIGWFIVHPSTGKERQCRNMADAFGKARRRNTFVKNNLSAHWYAIERVRVTTLISAEELNLICKSQS